MITKNRFCIILTYACYLFELQRSKLKRGDSNKNAKTVNNNKPNMLQETPKDKAKFTQIIISYTEDNSKIFFL